MKRIFKYLSGALLALFLVGCGGAAIQNIDNSGTIDNKASLKQVEQAIKKGAMRKNWSTKKIKTGQLEARVNVRGRHVAMVTIDYNRTGYKITYKDSQNLKYNAEKQTIHKSYNKWIATLERNINYELARIGLNPSASNYTPSKHVAPKVVAAKPVTSNYKKVSNADLSGKTIYIKSIVPYSPTSMVATNIKTECTLDKQLSDFIVEFARNNDVKIEVKDNISKNDLELKVQIDNAVSRGGAFRGHNKWVAISGALVKGNVEYYSFKAARLSGGGFWGAYKSSCSVLGRTVQAIGKDTAIWLSSPMDGARLGDTHLIQP